MSRSLLPLGLLLAAVACNLQDANTPVPQADTLILGRISAVPEVAGEAGVSELEIKAGLPEAVKNVRLRDGRSVPELEKDLVVKVRVTGESVCWASLRPGDLSDFRVGHEVAVEPVPGSSALVGNKLLTAEAAQVFLFASYQVYGLPRSLATLPGELRQPNDPERINSAGLELTPLPVRDGRVLYFAAGLQPSPLAGAESAPFGAERPGMRAGGTLAAWAVGGFRPYRSEWLGGRWSPPQPVALLGLAEKASARLTWINDAETACLVEVVEGTGAEPTRRLLAGQRTSAKEPWGALQPVALATGASVGDAQRFGTQLKALVWTVYQPDNSDLWLSLDGKPGQALEPRINTLGPEYAPRVGPNNVLYFCRADRQLLFAHGVVQDVRLPGRQRRPLLEAAPTAGGARLFFRVPRLTPGGLGWDLATAARKGDGWDAAVLLDEWRPQ
jgi:hypothetical protein